MKSHEHISARCLVDSLSYTMDFLKRELTQIRMPGDIPAAARLTTFYLRMPRFILAEFNTHRCISKSAESSRAIGVERRVKEMPTFIPVMFGANKIGKMTDDGEEVADVARARSVWGSAAREAAVFALELNSIGLHKQLANRVYEPFSYVDVIATASGIGWLSFLKLRLHHAAQPEMQVLAASIWRYFLEAVEVRDPETATVDSKGILSPYLTGPTRLTQSMWHLPFVGHTQCYSLRQVVRSVACCARVSYGNARKEFDPTKDMELYEKLFQSPFHAGPFEHQATPAHSKSYAGLSRNFGFNGGKGCWVQHRAKIDTDIQDPISLVAFDSQYERINRELIR